MSERPNSQRHWTEGLLIVASVGVLLVCGYYAFALAFLVPYPGLSIDVEWTVLQVDSCDSHPGWCDGDRALLLVGDQLIAIGDLLYDEYRQDRRVVPFAGYGPGESVPITLYRDGQERAIRWEMPVPTAAERLSGLIGLLVCVPFWAAGTLGLLFLRPRGEHWRLLTTFFYLIAVWLAAGLASHTHVASSSLVMHSVTWLLVIVCLHLHALVPAPIFGPFPRYLTSTLHAVAVVLAFLEVFQFLPESAYLLGLVFAILGSLGFLVWRLIDSSFHSVKPATDLMLGSVGLAFGPGLVLNLIPTLLGHPVPGWIAIAASLLSVPVLPLGYTYAIGKRRLSSLEFRANRAISMYGFVLLYGTLFVLIHLLGTRWIGSGEHLLAADMIMSLLFIVAAPPLYDRLRRVANRLIYSTKHEPQEILHAFAARISARLSLEELGDLLAGEISRSLLIRQSALYLSSETEHRLVYASGVESHRVEDMLCSLQSPPIRMGEYIPPASEECGSDGRGGDESGWVRLAIPLMVREQAIGAWLLGRRDPDDFYPRDDVALLTTLGSQVAVAVENTRLFHAAQHEIGERRQAETVLLKTNRALRVLSRCGQTLVRMTGESALMDAFCEHLVGFGGYRFAWVGLAEQDEHKTVRPVAQAGFEEGYLDTLKITWADTAYGRGPTGTAIRTGKPATARDIHTDPRYEPWRADAIKRGYGSSTALPLVVDGHILGTLNVYSHETDAFDAEELGLLMEVADDLAYGIVSLQTRAKRRQAEERATALARIASQLNSRLDVDTILSTVCGEAVHNLHATAASVHLSVSDSEWLMCANQVGFPLDAGKELPPIPYALYESHYRRDGSPTYVQDLQATPDLVGGDFVAKLGARTSATAAMVVDERVCGILTIVSFGEVMDLEDDELAFLQRLADQAAVAIVNATLLEQSRQSSEELAMLNKVGRLMSSTLDPETILETMMHQAVVVLQAECGSILLLDSDRGDLILQATYGPGADQLRGRRLLMGQGIAGWVAQHGRSCVVRDVQADDRFYPQIDAETQFVTRSTVCVPLVHRGEIIGVVQVLNKKTHEFTADDQRLLEALAATAANAIENARLFEALEEERSGLAERVRSRTMELEMANEELIRAARLKDEFLASMSHELRTPLNAILGLSEVLRTEIYGPLDERQQRSVRIIERSGQHLLNLINDVLDVAKIESGQMELEILPVSIDAVCQASLQFIKQQALKKQIKVTSVVDTTVTVIGADERRLKQILINLLTNAVKFTPEGGEVGLEVKGEEGDRITLAVWDTGIGIAPEDQDRLFKPFVQLDSSLSRQHTGTGLGLALVRRLVELHGGSVTVTSEGIPGKGSRFTVSLPWQEPVKVVCSPNRDAELQDGTLLVQPSSAKASILLADDDEVNVDMTVDYLRTKGYDVIVARNGIEAVELVTKMRPDLILMDIQMPEMDGLEATRRIRAIADQGLALTPIIALTALAMPGDEDRCLDAGASTYISKPVNLRSLTGMIETQLSSRI